VTYRPRTLQEAQLDATGRLRLIQWEQWRSMQASVLNACDAEGPSGARAVQMSLSQLLSNSTDTAASYMTLCDHGAIHTLLPAFTKARCEHASRPRQPLAHRAWHTNLEVGVESSKCEWIDLLPESAFG
jgi:hypothetical protein